MSRGSIVLQPHSLAHKTCSDCLQVKQVQGFPIQKEGIRGRRNTCKKCFGIYQYQRQLEKRMIEGYKDVAECEICEQYFKRMSAKNVCFKCR